MYPIYEIDDAQAANIMATQENYLNDIKAREIKPAKRSETISAFANAAGGDVYIGIGEDKAANLRTWKGFDDPEQANDFFASLEFRVGCRARRRSGKPESNPTP